MDQVGQVAARGYGGYTASAPLQLQEVMYCRRLTLRPPRNRYCSHNVVISHPSNVAVVRGMFLLFGAIIIIDSFVFAKAFKAVPSVVVVSLAEKECVIVVKNVRTTGMAIPIANVE